MMSLLRPCPLSRQRAFGQVPSRYRQKISLRADATGLGTIAATLPIVAVGGVAAWKFALYGQLEYITASMLTNYVPKGEPGPRVIQLQGGTRELYYYPKSTVQVTVVGENVNKGLLEQAGLQAAVPTVAKQQSPANLGFASDGSVDAVVSLGAVAGMSEQQRAVFTTEALRVLRPGCPIIFVERIPGGLPIRFLGASSATLAESYLQGWKERNDAFELVQWDVALEGQDPHAVGVAVKSADYRAPLVSRRAEKAAEKAERERAEKDARKEKSRLPKKGFDKVAGQ
ncbi:hypothetical protein VOLCADRAFT_118240 [Volvox carteri f. nagariensis]|uniref:Methyltransferase type 11 domain-containing protein n=1 Tax=Volvox carteri f. nagariensis TaxID=3068 RepID=D8U2W2_VOLCA|nr:uncharacterized protein VOLCADRAFT_118240 [Volvox carteri f. nagariensis]EFJ45877.1 hypothetical protein VOLCADRAFT_118240 [Volvox carteri f. nagariensis]|eukprot:XP_002952955.1 hypothetical protein VOLCADRAFT_118240 [Volvox carteri f. nagariensis]